MHRRQFLATVGVASTVVVAGCTGGSDHALSGDAWDGAERQEQSASVTVSTTLSIPEGEYAVRKFTEESATLIEVEFDVVSGGPIDVFFLEDGEYEERYRDGDADEIQFLSGLSAAESSGETLRSVVEEGEYVLTFDNTGTYGASPDGEASVDVTVVSAVPAAEHIQSAVENIDQVGTIIDEQSSGGSSDFEADVVNARLDDAEADLDEAERVASERQQEEVDQLRAIVAWLRTMTDALDALDEGLTSFETANSYFQSERYDDARSKVDEATSQFETSKSTVEDARNDFEAVDASALDEYDVAAAESAMGDLSALAEAMVEFSAGFRELVTGFQRFQEGAKAFDDEDYGDAIDPFESARESFASAESTFEGQEEDALPEMAASTIELTCLAGSMKDASDHFATAATKARNGKNDQAREAAQKGREAADRCQ